MIEKQEVIQKQDHLFLKSKKEAAIAAPRIDFILIFNFIGAITVLTVPPPIT